MPTREYTLPDGRTLRHGTAFQIDGVGSFPRNWLELATPSDLTRYNITVEVLPDPPPPPITANQVQAEAERRIDAQYAPAFRESKMSEVLEILDSGQPMPAGVKAALKWMRDMRAAADALAAQNPIPTDYATNETYWPDAP